MDHCNSSLTSCRHGPEMMKTMRRQQELVMQLRALALPLLHRIDGTSAEIAVQLFDDVISCNLSVVSSVEGCLILSTAARGAMEPVDDKSSVRKNLKNTATTTTIGDRTDEQAQPITNSVGQKRRRNDKRSRSLVTHVPHYDGHQWRKYGQKNINGRRHPRSYYRCTYRDRNCFATKTIEQQEPNYGTTSSAMDDGEEIAKYTVVYYGDHTCKDHSISMVQLPQLVTMDPQNTEIMAQISTYVQDPEVDLDLPALLEVFDSSLLDWDDWKM